MDRQSITAAMEVLTARWPEIGRRDAKPYERVLATADELDFANVVERLEEMPSPTSLGESISKEYARRRRGEAREGGYGDVVDEAEKGGRHARAIGAISLAALAIESGTVDSLPRYMVPFVEIARRHSLDPDSLVRRSKGDDGAWRAEAPGFDQQAAMAAATAAIERALTEEIPTHWQLLKAFSRMKPKEAPDV